MNKGLFLLFSYDFSLIEKFTIWVQTKSWDDPKILYTNKINIIHIDALYPPPHVPPTAIQPTHKHKHPLSVEEHTGPTVGHLKCLRRLGRVQVRGFSCVGSFWNCADGVWFD